MENPVFLNPADKLVLVADDHESIRELIVFVVKKEGFRVEIAEDGEEALRKARLVSPDLILMDLMMPKFGGFEILRELQSYETAGIPIIVVTGRYTERSTTDMIKNEPNVLDFIEKPVKPQVLAAAIHKVLKTRPLQKKSGG